MTSSPSTALSVAAALGFVWGAIMLVIAAAIAASSPAVGANAAVLAVASAVAAQGVRRRRWPYVALGASTAWIAFLVLVPLKLSLPGIALNIAILGLVLTNLRRFR